MGGRIQFAPTPNGKFIRFIAMDNESDIIITPNKKDFKNSKIPIMTAGEYILEGKRLPKQAFYVTLETRNQYIAKAATLAIYYYTPNDLLK